MVNLISAACFSYPKNFEKKNEDSILPPLELNGGYLFAIADGVGSYAGAKEASHSVINYLRNLESFDKNFDGLFLKLKEIVSDLSNEDMSLSKAATTLTICYIDNIGVYIGHIGDSRAYLKENGRFIQLTKDDTQHQKLLDEKIYTKKELKGLSGKNVLTTAISKNIDLYVQSYFLPIRELEDKSNIIISLMTDGCHSYWERRPKLSDKTMNSPASFSNSLQKRIERLEPTDDYSLVICKLNIR